jgi:hypothetical protein
MIKSKEKHIFKKLVSSLKKLAHHKITQSAERIEHSINTSILDIQNLRMEFENRIVRHYHDCQYFLKRQMKVERYLCASEPVLS